MTHVFVYVYIYMGECQNCPPWQNDLRELMLQDSFKTTRAEKLTNCAEKQNVRSCNTFFIAPLQNPARHRFKTLRAERGHDFCKIINTIACVHHHFVRSSTSLSWRTHMHMRIRTHTCARSYMRSRTSQHTLHVLVGTKKRDPR